MGRATSPQIRRLLVAGTFIVLLLVAAVPAPASADEDPFGIGDKYREYGVVDFDRGDLLRQMEAGQVLLRLGADAFLLEVEPVPWSTTYTVNELQPDGTAITRATHETWVYHGSAVGHEGSNAMLIVTDAGVDGFVRGIDAPVFIETARYFDDDALQDQSIYYRPNDLRIMEGFGVDDVAPLPPSPTDPVHDGAADAHGSGPDREMNLWSDPEMMQVFGEDWNDKVWSVYNQLNEFYLIDVQFNFVDGQLYYCTTQSCAENFGMTSTDRRHLLSEWAGSIDKCSNCGDYEIAHLFTGKELDGNYIGRAYLPGNKGISQMVDAGGTYDGGSSNYEAALLVMHETGHNFNGRHERATTYGHQHCVLSTRVLCVLPDNRVHYTTMYASMNHEPEDGKEMMGEFSAGTTDGNWQHVRDCNAHSWTKDSYGTRCRS